MLIDLSDHFHPTQHSAVLFEQGRDLSAKLSLPACVKGAKSVTILLPHHVWYIGNRFFEGLFGSCLDKLGKDEFLKIFKFESDSPPILKSIPLLVNEVWLRLHPPVDHAALYDVEP